MDLTETEDIKKRWQEYTELYRKDLQDPDNHDHMITYLEQDILECEVKWALGSITMNKAMEVMEVLWAISNPKRWCCESTALNMPAILKTQLWPQDWKRPAFIPIPKKGNAKEWSNCRTIAFISHASIVMLKMFQIQLQQYMNQELPEVQRKGRVTRD